MFDFVTKHKRYMQVVLGLLILPFAFFGVESYMKASRGAADAATVDGTPVTMREFADEARRQQERLRQALGPGADLSAFDTPEMRQQILDGLISRRLVTNEVADAQLTLSHDEAVASIMAAPEFQENGRFSAARYENYLRVVGLSDEGNVQKLRLEIPAARLASAIAGSAFVPKAVAARLAAIEGEKREVAEAFLPAQSYLARVKTDDAALKTYYEAHLADYRIPERVRAEYVVLSAQELGRAEGVSDAEIKAAYEAKAGQFGVPEQRRASHILLATRAEAEQVLAEARKNPQGFAELAKKRSQDSGTAANGGDLGMNPRGALAAKPLEDAIFKLARPGDLSDVVQTEFGFHVVRLTAIEPGKSRSLDEVRAELAAQLAAEKGAKKFAEAAENFNNMVYEQSDSLKPVADRYKLQIATTGWFSRQAPGDIGPLANPKLLAALFSPDSIKQRRNTDAVEVSPGVLVAARVAEQQPEKQRPFDEVKADVAQRVARREAAALARKEGEEKLAALAKGGDAGLAWGAAKTVSRQESQGLPPAALRKLMSADAAKLPAYVGFEHGDDGYAVYRIVRVIPAAAPDAAHAAQDQARYDREAASDQLDAYVASLRARAKVDIKPANLEPK